MLSLYSQHKHEHSSWKKRLCLHHWWKSGPNVIRLDHQPLLGKGAQGVTQTRHERAAEIKPIMSYTCFTCYYEFWTPVLFHLFGWLPVFLYQRLFVRTGIIYLATIGASHWQQLNIVFVIASEMNCTELIIISFFCLQSLINPLTLPTHHFKQLQRSLP